MSDVADRPWRHPWHRPTPRSVRARVRVVVTAAAVGAGVAAAVPRVEGWLPPAPAALPVAVVTTAALIVLVVVEARGAPRHERPGTASWACLTAAVALTAWALAAGPAWVLPVAALLAVPAGLASAEGTDEERIQLRATAWLCWSAVATAAAVRMELGPGASAIAFVLGLAAFGGLHGAVAVALTDRAYACYDLDATTAAAGLFVLGGGVSVAVAGPPAVGASIGVIGAAIVLGRVVAVAETVGRPRFGMRGPIALGGLGVAGLGAGFLREGWIAAGVVVAALGALVLAGVLVTVLRR